MGSVRREELETCLSPHNQPACSSDNAVTRACSSCPGLDSDHSFPAPNPLKVGPFCLRTPRPAGCIYQSTEFLLAETLLNFVFATVP